MVITKDLGAVSAYAYAVEQGYQGTEEEFAELMARQATVAEEAAASADAAAESASEAQASAEQAEQSAQSISGDVERAEQAATTATGKATEAATSATTANGAAQTATGKAAQAEQSATAAANSASAAATSATNAASSATAAQTAQTAAETAQGKAEDAQAAAEAAAASIDPDTLVKKTELEDYAKIDGSYETMTVGNAEQLVATVGVDDSTPYNFRTSGGSVDIGDRETVNAVVGGTVAWNQLLSESNLSPYAATIKTITPQKVVLIPNGGYSSTLHYGATINSIALYAIPLNHVLFVCVDCTSTKADKFRVRIGNTMLWSASVSANTTVRINAIAPLVSSTLTVYAYDDTLYSTADEITFQNWNIFDLTVMFGSTIADYIYSLEQANAGAGVAYFRKLFPKDYYEYNAGELLSVNTSQHKMVGFNQWDEEWERGTIGMSTGQNVDSNDKIRSKNYVPILPNTTYYFKMPNNWRMCYYDANKNLLENGTTYDPNITLTSPDGAYYLRFVVDGTTTYANDICINLSWDGERDGEYEPYKEWVYPLDSSLTLRGIPKLDASGNLYYDGDTYAADGAVMRKYGIVDLGTLSWAKNDHATLGTYFYANITSQGVKYSGSFVLYLTNAVCANYINTVRTQSYFLDKCMCFDGNPGIGQVTQIQIKDSGYSDAATFNTAMNGVYLVYELATPTTETAEPYTQIQSVDDFGTEEYTDYAYENGDRDVAIPVGHNTVYSPNLRAKLEMSPNSPDGDGLYVVEQSNGQNEYVPLVIPTELPTAPSEDGTYTLKITVSGGTVTKSWIAEE